MKFNTKSVVSLVLAVLMVGAASFGAMAAAPSLDEETTDTSTQTELDGTSTQEYNESTSSWLNFTADSTNASVLVLQNGTELAEYENSSSELQFDETVSGTSYYGLEVDDDASDYPGIEAGPGEDVDVTFRMINDTESANQDTTNVTVTFANDANTTFARMDDGETRVADSSRSSIGESLSALNVFANDSEDDAGAAEVEDDISVAGDSQDRVTVYIANSDAQDSIAEVYSANEEADLFSTIAFANYDGSIVPVFAEGNDVPDWFDEDATHMTVSEDGTTVDVVNPGASLSDSDDETSMSMTANDAIGFRNAWSLSSDYGASLTDQISAATSSFDINGSPELAEV